MTRLLCLIFLLAVSINALAQGEANSLEGMSFKDRVFTGGGFGLGFSSIQDYISVSPVVGYMFTKKLVAGLNLSYTYASYKVVKPSLKLSHYGGGPFARFTVYQNFFIQSEYEYMNYELPRSNGETIRLSYESVLAGGGIMQPLGKNAALYLMALYNFSYRTPQPGQFSPYNSPWVIRAGVNIGNFGF